MFALHSIQFLKFLDKLNYLQFQGCYTIIMPLDYYVPSKAILWTYIYEYRKTLMKYL